jgi:hypothetical protein
VELSNPDMTARRAGMEEAAVATTNTSTKIPKAEMV